jgi:hypothetical protein
MYMWGKSDDLLRERGYNLKVKKNLSFASYILLKSDKFLFRSAKISKNGYTIIQKIYFSYQSRKTDVPLANPSRPPRGTRPPGWEPLI